MKPKVAHCTFQPTFQAAAENLVKFDGVSYSGDALRLAGWKYPVAFDLSSIRVGKTTMRWDHRDEAEAVVGHAESRIVDGRRIELSGTISRQTPAAIEVADAARNEYPWQVSVGVLEDAVPDATRFVPAGKTVTVNHRRLSGPLFVIHQGELIETSFVDRGADPGNRIKIAARKAAALERTRDMEAKFKAWLETNDLDPDTLEGDDLDAAKAEFDEEKARKAAAKRKPRKEDDSANVPADLDQAFAAAKQEAGRRKAIAGITRRALDENPDQVDFIEKRAKLAIDENESPERYEVDLYRDLAPRGAFASRGSGRNLTKAHYVAALGRTYMMPNREKVFGADICQQADDWLGPIGLKETVAQVAAANGYNGSPHLTSSRDVESAVYHAKAPQHGRMARAAGAADFSTINVPGILSDFANKFLDPAFTFVEQTWSSIARERSMRDFKPHRIYRLGGDFEFKQVPRTGELTHAKPAETDFTNQVKTWGRMLGIGMQDIVDDDLSAFTEASRLIGRGAGIALNKLFWTTFLDDAAFFAAGNGNLLTGTANALSYEGLSALETKFMEQTDGDGNPLGLDPAILLVPPKLKLTAEQLLTSTALNMAATGVGSSAAITETPNGNVFQRKYRLAVSRYLADALGGSDTAYYLLADPQALATVEVGFLNGQRSPVVESSDADFNVLGFRFRGYWNFGVSLIDPLAGMKATGEAE